MILKLHLLHAARHARFRVSSASVALGSGCQLCCGSVTTAVRVLTTFPMITTSTQKQFYQKQQQAYIALWINISDLSVPTMYCCLSNSFSRRSNCSWVKIVRTRLPLLRPARDLVALTQFVPDASEKSHVK